MADSCNFGQNFAKQCFGASLIEGSRRGEAEQSRLETARGIA